MKWTQALETKDQMIKQSLYDTFRDDEETMDRIDQAFQDGKQAWIRHMRNIFGPADSEKLVAALARDVS